MKEVRRKNAILEILSKNGECTFANISKMLKQRGIFHESDTLYYDIKNMMRSGEIKTGDSVGVRGGATFTINFEKPPKIFERKTFIIKFPKINE